MRKIVSLLIVGSVVLGAFTATDALAGKKKKTRKASAPYSGPAVGIPGASICSPGTLGCVEFPTGTKERFVSASITDQTGLPVPASVTQDLDGDNFADTSSDICGASEGPIVIEPGIPVNVFIYAVPSAGCAGTATSGTIDMKFSNKP